MLAKVVQLKSSIRCVKDNVAFYESSEEELKIELGAVVEDSTWLSQLVDDMRVGVVDLREQLGQWMALFGPS